ncbi:uncharacterized protein LOC106173998 [Lingula anatina]|uniref:RanBP-type and C3HC4-type zinc finger-containing protein 1 n=1 Tax=Lingula anatina TaxID=7574 RepID=A0A1S3JKB9_LINAN|nr:uncharacterized protein LOC106173998 [Lingula anatina]|eukprot:XP_013410818.1 uncharacterized protein LOC106173998 [Lingula anatina]
MENQHGFIARPSRPGETHFTPPPQMSYLDQQGSTWRPAPSGNRNGTENNVMQRSMIGLPGNDAREYIAGRPGRQQDVMSQSVIGLPGNQAREYIVGRPGRHQDVMSQSVIGLPGNQAREYITGRPGRHQDMMSQSVIGLPGAQGSYTGAASHLQGGLTGPASLAFEDPNLRQRLVEAQIRTNRKKFIDSLTTGDQNYGLYLDQLVSADAPLKSKYQELDIEKLLINNAKSPQSLQQMSTALGILEKYGRNLLKPLEIRPAVWREIKFSNSVFRDRVQPMTCSLLILQQMGYTLQVDDGLAYPQDSEPVLEDIARLVAELVLAKTEIDLYRTGQHPMKHRFDEVIEQSQGQGDFPEALSERTEIQYPPSAQKTQYRPQQYPMTQSPPVQFQSPPTQYQSPPTQYQFPPTQFQSPPTQYQPPQLTQFGAVSQQQQLVHSGMGRALQRPPSGEKSNIGCFKPPAAHEYVNVPPVPVPAAGRYPSEGGGSSGGRGKGGGEGGVRIDTAGLRPPPQDASLCYLCGEEIGIIRCDNQDCNDMFCESCDQLFHKHKVRQGHKRVQIYTSPGSSTETGLSSQQENQASASLTSPVLKGQDALPNPSTRVGQSPVGTAIPGGQNDRLSPGLSSGASSPSSMQSSSLATSPSGQIGRKPPVPAPRRKSTASSTSSPETTTPPTPAPRKPRQSASDPSLKEPSSNVSPQSEKLASSNVTKLSVFNTDYSVQGGAGGHEAQSPFTKTETNLLPAVNRAEYIMDAQKIIEELEAISDPENKKTTLDARLIAIEEEMKEKEKRKNNIIKECPDFYDNDTYAVLNKLIMRLQHQYHELIVYKDNLKEAEQQQQRQQHQQLHVGGHDTLPQGRLGVIPLDIKNPPLQYTPPPSQPYTLPPPPSVSGHFKQTSLDPESSNSVDDTYTIMRPPSNGKYKPQLGALTGEYRTTDDVHNMYIQMGNPPPGPTGVSTQSEVTKASTQLSQKQCLNCQTLNYLEAQWCSQCHQLFDVETTESFDEVKHQCPTCHKRTDFRKECCEFCRYPIPKGLRDSYSPYKKSVTLPRSFHIPNQRSDVVSGAATLPRVPIEHTVPPPGVSNPYHQGQEKMSNVQGVSPAGNRFGGQISPLSQDENLMRVVPGVERPSLGSERSSPGVAATQRFQSQGSLWSCEHCTYLNEANMRVCEMCNRTSDNPQIVEKAAPENTGPMTLPARPYGQSVGPRSGGQGTGQRPLRQSLSSQISSSSAGGQRSYIQTDQEIAEEKIRAQTMMLQFAREDREREEQQRSSATDLVGPSTAAQQQFGGSKPSTGPGLQAAVPGGAHVLNLESSSMEKPSTGQTAGARPKQATQLGVSGPRSGNYGGGDDVLAELAKKKDLEALRTEGSSIIKLLRDLDEGAYDSDEIDLALDMRKEGQNPKNWLEEDWESIIETLLVYYQQAGDKMEGENLGRLSSLEAKAALKKHGGNVQAALTECIESRKEKYTDLAHGSEFKREQILEALHQNKGDVEEALKQLNKEVLHPFLASVWAGREEEERDEIEGTNNERSIHDEQHIKDVIFNKDVDEERRIRLLLVEGNLQGWERGKLALKIADNIDDLEGSPTLEEVVDASKNSNGTYQEAIKYLQTECMVCFEKQPMNRIRTLALCHCYICRECLKQGFEVYIKDRHVKDWVCPNCNEPDIDDEDIASRHFQFLDLMLQNLVARDVYELFQQKLRDWNLMKEENFRWCAHCDNGFIWNPEEGAANNLKMNCPKCLKGTCYGCKKHWEAAHEDLTCEAFADWKESNDPELQAQGLAKHLEENGIDCPNCNFRYALAKGGCMHFKCTQCRHEFCAGCYQAFKRAENCKMYSKCATSGLHCHHPRDCLFYLRDNSVKDLQKLLQDNEIQFDTEQPPPVEGEEPRDRNACRVMEQKETVDGLKDEFCGRQVPPRYAGLCEIHYKEYLVSLINRHHIDPLIILSLNEIKVVLGRVDKQPLKRNKGEKDPDYKKRLIEFVQREVPLTSMRPSHRARSRPTAV